jgi:nitrate/nitrite-specific signal transduction histidine kinase
MLRRHFTLLANTLIPSTIMGYSISANAQILNLNDAINKAGRQRMLSQRMAKSYIAQGLGIVESQAEKTLSMSMSIFDRNLVELRVYATRPEIKATYQQLDAKWSDYKAALVGKKPSAQSAVEVLTLSNEVLALANQGTSQLEALATKPAAKLVNVAGRQRMLSQRMASHFLATSWNVEAQKSRAEMLKARDEFVAAMASLKVAPETTPRIAQELALADQQFVFFQAALQQTKIAAGDKQSQSEVFLTSERILQVMENITDLYTQIT